MRPRLSVIPAASLAAGLLSALLSALVTHGVLNGLLVVPFLPLVPIMMAGFAYGTLGVSGAALAALLATPLLCGIEAGLVILAVQIFPAWLFTRELLKARIEAGPTADQPPRLRYAPPGHAFTAVALYAAVFILLMYAVGPGQFESFLDLLNKLCLQAVTEMKPDAVPPALTGGAGLKQALLVFGVWGMIFTLYAAACLANFIVLSFRNSARPSLRFTPYTPRGYVLAAIASAALIGLIDTDAGSLTDVARIVCLMLLLPYLLSGLGSIHAALSRWQHPAIWQLGFYLLLFTTVWPALPIALFGIVRQVSRLTAVKEQ